MEIGLAIILGLIILGLLAACEHGKWREGTIEYKEKDDVESFYEGGKEDASTPSKT
jgi:hypothetical protein